VNQRVKMEKNGRLNKKLKIMREEEEPVTVEENQPGPSAKSVAGGGVKVRISGLMDNFFSRPHKITNVSLKFDILLPFSGKGGDKPQWEEATKHDCEQWS